MFDTFIIDLSQAWLECENFYHYLKNTYISLFGATISLGFDLLGFCSDFSFRRFPLL